MAYQVQRQRTAGAYIALVTTNSHDEAVAFLANIAAQHPNRPYKGEDKWQDSTNVHNVNRYRIVPLQIQ